MIQTKQSSVKEHSQNNQRVNIMPLITGRCIWITGASSGLGKALAEQLAEAGNFVIVSARSHAALSQLACQYPGKIKSLPLDLSRNLDLKDTVQRLREITDYLDMVICAASVFEYEDHLNFSPDMYDRTLDVNFLGVVRAFNVALPLLRNSKSRPHFVAISCLSACVGFPRAEAYGASKAALNYFMRSLRADFSKIELDLSLVRPSTITSNLMQQKSEIPFLKIRETNSPHIVSQQILKKLSKRRFLIDLPQRLSWPLVLCRLSFNLWCKWIAPKLTRIHQW